MIVAAWICLLTPLGAALAITLAGNRITRRGAGYLASASVGISFVSTLVTFALLWGDAADNRSHPSTIWEWLTAGRYHFGLRILVDPLSVFMMLVVSGVGFLIVVYSIGYMDGDNEERRYFAYMALFVFSMLLLVQGGNLLMLLVGWGLVGLSSYLLIGFWHERPSAVAAAKKAFVMNAIGDATMALSFFVLILHTHSLSFADAFSVHLSSTAMTFVALGLLGGAAAKSAQIPLHTWLPDAMEGPTPVSALIHAATMVTAGVYLIARTHPIFEQARTVQLVAAGMGTLTLLVAGLIALVQVDIKRVIAYSTMSQIGYMFLAVGIGTYANGMFHLMTHAFFKALLFMAAGIVIHALSGEQDIRNMRGIGQRMPWTKWAFLAGSLALVGVPPFSGFFSKDAILAAALHAHWYGVIFWVVGLVGTFLTGLYTFRLYFIVFGGGEPKTEPHLHDGREGPLTMLVPVGILTVLAVIGGWIQFAPFWHPLTDWLEPVARTLSIAEPKGWQEALSSVLAVALGLAGIGVAWAIYSDGRLTVPRVPALQRALEHKLYFDEAYDLLFYKPAVAVANYFRRTTEEEWILPVGGEFGEVTLETGRLTRRLQTGLLRTYVLLLGTGMAVMAIVFLLVR